MPQPMPLIVFHTRRVREALSNPSGLWAELFFLALVASLIAGLVMVGKQVSAPYTSAIHIDLSIRALPKYTLLSLGRGFMAYFLSLIFTLVYGTIAAHNARAEKLMLPALDVLQAIPVLGFLPGLVLAMIALFPNRAIGLELACVIMIFTGQAWNMTFSFHGSLKSIPQPLREVAAVHGLGWWKTFRLVEVPAAMIGLVWNSMMSMAGGWFFLTVNESFRLKDHDYRLPGIGSYMSEAIDRGNVPAMLSAIFAMTLMIIVVDQLFWRPIVVWAQRFKMEETADVDRPQSWVLSILERSQLYNRIGELFNRRRRRHRLTSTGILNARVIPAPAWWLVAMARTAFVVALLAAAGWGAYAMTRLLVQLPWHNPISHSDWMHVLLGLGASFARTSAAVLLGAAWALPVGILIGLSPRWSQRLQPVIQVVASFPAPMLFPLVTILLVILHIPFTIGCVALMLLGAQWYILFNVIAGASAIPADLKEVAMVNGMSRRERWTRLYIPCVFPYLVTGLVTAAGGAWNATIVAEYIKVKDHVFTAFGLGSTIFTASEGDFPLLCASILTMAVFVVLINRLFWRRLYRLAEERYSLNV